MNNPLSVSAGLEPYTEPLSQAKAAHLLRRALFSASPDSISAAVGRDPGEYVVELVSDAVNRPLPNPPEWVDNFPPPRGSTQEIVRAYMDANRAWLREYRASWFEEMIVGGLRERMALLWHDHFVTGIETYRYAILSVRYLTLLRTHALGSFETFVRDIGLDPSMLIYLNGNTNQVGQANENYARELMELFTMGSIGPDGTANYSEFDVQQVARALTGWVVNPLNAESLFIPIRHDEGEKTIFDIPGNFGYDDVVNLIFSERAGSVAYFVARKLYTGFVYEVPDETILSDLSQVLIDNNFAIDAAVRRLLSSAHFFDDEVVGAHIKSPVDLLVGMHRELILGDSSSRSNFYQRVAMLTGQTLFNPPNVAGWPGYHTWVSTNTLPIRWLAADALLNGGGDGTPPDLVPFAGEVLDPNDPEVAFFLPSAIAGHLFSIPLDDLDIPEISEELIGDLVQNPVPESVLNAPPHVLNLAKIFLSGIPWYEWYLFNPGSNDRLLAFVRYLLQFPEYQLD